jgi:hypothetical protein
VNLDDWKDTIHNAERPKNAELPSERLMALGVVLLGVENLQRHLPHRITAFSPLAQSTLSGSYPIRVTTTTPGGPNRRQTTPRPYIDIVPRVARGRARTAFVDNRVLSRPVRTIAFATGERQTGRVLWRPNVISRRRGANG